MFELIITITILASATALFKSFWDVVYNWCYGQAQKFIKSFTTLVKSGYNVVSYYYYRKQDGWQKRPVEAQKIERSQCPLDVRNALFDYDEVIVQKY